MRVHNQLSRSFSRPGGTDLPGRTLIVNSKSKIVNRNLLFMGLGFADKLNPALVSG